MSNERHQLIIIRDMQHLIGSVSCSCGSSCATFSTYSHGAQEIATEVVKSHGSNVNIWNLALEEACREICEYCQKDIPAIQLTRGVTATLLPGRYAHVMTDDGRVLQACLAGKIRELRRSTWTVKD